MLDKEVINIFKDINLREKFSPISPLILTLTRVDSNLLFLFSTIFRVHIEI